MNVPIMIFSHMQTMRRQRQNGRMLLTETSEDKIIWYGPMFWWLVGTMSFVFLIMLLGIIDTGYSVKVPVTSKIKGVSIQRHKQHDHYYAYTEDDPDARISVGPHFQVGEEISYFRKTGYLSGVRMIPGN